MSSGVLQPFIERLLYPLVDHYRGGAERAQLKHLRRSQYFPAEQLELLRLERLRSILRHAAHYVPFYKRRFQGAGFQPAKLKDFSELRGLPLLTAEEIVVHREELLSSYYKPEDLIENRSEKSGLVFYHNRERIETRHASLLRHNEWAGYRVGSKAIIIQRHPDELSHYGQVAVHKRSRLLDRSVTIEAADLSEAVLQTIVQAFRKSRPHTILANPISLTALIDYCGQKSLKIPVPHSVITTGEFLTEESRRRIEEFFHCRVFDRYASRAFGTIASECESHDGLHVSAESLFIEVLRKGAPCEPGQAGEVVITDLGNFGFPLIRYQTGDTAMLLPEQCSCGRTLPRLKLTTPAAEANS